MKLGTLNKLMMATFLVAMTLALTACPGGGGGSGDPAVGVGALGTGTSGYVGIGNWNGAIQIQNLQIYQEFLYQSGLCYGQSCANVGPWMTLNIQTNDPSGMLPNLVYFKLGTVMNYSNSGGQGQYGYGSYNGNGIIIQWNGNTNGYGVGGGYGGYPGYGYGQPGYPNYPGSAALPAGTSLLQINTQFTDGTHQGMNVQVFYMGQQFAAGTIVGSVYPGSGQYGGSGYGGGYPNGYSGGYPGGYTYGGVVPFNH